MVDLNHEIFSNNEQFPNYGRIHLVGSGRRRRWEVAEAAAEIVHSCQLS